MAIRYILCPYCGHVQPPNPRCTKCLGIFEPLSRMATQIAMGPWFIRNPKHPFQPGFSYQTLKLRIASGHIKPNTILRGPTTHQFWSIARNTPGVAHLLGRCHACTTHLTPPTSPDTPHNQCPHCHASFDFTPQRDHLGLSYPTDHGVTEAQKRLTAEQTRLASIGSSPQTDTTPDSALSQPTHHVHPTNTADAHDDPHTHDHHDHHHSIIDGPPALSHDERQTNLAEITADEFDDMLNDDNDNNDDDSTNHDPQPYRQRTQPRQRTLWLRIFWLFIALLIIPLGFTIVILLWTLVNAMYEPRTPPSLPTPTSLPAPAAQTTPPITQPLENQKTTPPSPHPTHTHTTSPHTHTTLPTPISRPPYTPPPPVHQPLPDPAIELIAQANQQARQQQWHDALKTIRQATDTMADDDPRLPTLRNLIRYLEQRDITQRTQSLFIPSP